MLNRNDASHILHGYGAFKQQGKGTFRLGDLTQITVGIHLRREHHAQWRDPFGGQCYGQFHRGFIACAVIVEGDQHLLNPVLCKGLPVIGCNPVHTVSRCDMAVPGHPERQRIDQRFTQDQAF
ncbi:hypothetical protein Xvie_02610 [Xenorhabdus vietnamensis]|uniref:Uncharacterized protein n=1 Tax=Xenorhabdus vietnamensis TaxID=351656 RepID=A0A1Y2SDD5_9GAMM|nr:hypothetical protein Xvie_02610 [Xenorhabdus vietnamensis]